MPTERLSLSKVISHVGAQEEGLLTVKDNRRVRILFYSELPFK